MQEKLLLKLGVAKDDIYYQTKRNLPIIKLNPSYEVLIRLDEYDDYSGLTHTYPIAKLFVNKNIKLDTLFIFYFGDTCGFVSEYGYITDNLKDGVDFLKDRDMHRCELIGYNTATKVYMHFEFNPFTIKLNRLGF